MQLGNTSIAGDRALGTEFVFSRNKGHSQSGIGGTEEWKGDKKRVGRTTGSFLWRISSFYTL
jgi:hypothetical protein